VKAAVSIEPRRLEVREVPMPSLAADEVLVKVHYAGICGTDLHIFHGTSANVTYPVIQGHEFAGEVAEVGSGVRDVHVGARVVAEGRAGTGFRRDGAFAEYLSVPGDMLHVLAPGVDLFEATLIDPLACAINAVRQARLSSGEHLVIIGQGSSGLCMLQAARATIGCPIAVVDRREERLALSRRFGAELALEAGHADTDPLLMLSDWAGPAGIDCVIDATGNQEAINLALHLVRRDGRVVVYGVFGKRIEFDIDQVVYKQIAMTGAVGSSGCWEEAIQLVQQRRVELAPIVTRRVSLHSLAETFVNLENGSPEIKTVVQP
jgi:L-iditol 2-dehydrogenase